MTLVISKGLTLDNGTRAAAIAGVSPTLDYRFAREKREIETVSLTDNLTYTGGNQGTFTGSDGFIQRATTNVPRFDHDSAGRTSKGLLVEAQNTNLFPYSERFNISWTLQTVTTSLVNSQAPSGVSQVFRINDGTSVNNQNHRVHEQTISATGGQPFSSSFFVKNIDAEWVHIRDGTNASSTWFNLVTKTVGTQALSDVASIQELANGWLRLSIAFTPANTSSSVGIGFSPNDGTALFAGTTGASFLLWGAQLTSGPITSYIPTNGAAVTRTADSAVIDGTGVLTGTYTMVEKPAGCAVVSGTNINLQPGFTAERVMVFPAALDAGQITAIRGAM